MCNSTGGFEFAYPFPRIDKSLDAVAGSRFFSTLDLTSGCWQAPLNSEAQERSAFVIRDELWKWKVLPFGLPSVCASDFPTSYGEDLLWVTLEDTVALPGYGSLRAYYCRTLKHCCICTFIEHRTLRFSICLIKIKNKNFCNNLDAMSQSDTYLTL